MKDLDKYRQYFNMIDDKTPFSLFKNRVFELIELAEVQQTEKGYGSNGELPSLKGRGTTRLP